MNTNHDPALENLTLLCRALIHYARINGSDVRRISALHRELADTRSHLRQQVAP